MKLTILETNVGFIIVLNGISNAVTYVKGLHSVGFIIVLNGISNRQMVEMFTTNVGFIIVLNGISNNLNKGSKIIYVGFE